MSETEDMDDEADPDMGSYRNVPVREGTREELDTARRRMALELNEDLTYNETVARLVRLYEKVENPDEILEQ